MGAHVPRLAIEICNFDGGIQFPPLPPKSTNSTFDAKAELIDSVVKTTRSLTYLKNSK